MLTNQNADAIRHYMSLKYPMEIVEDDDGVVATIPDLPGCASFGDTIEAAVRSLDETKELWIKGRIDAGQPVPEPSQVEDFSGKFVLRIPRGLHKSLDREAKRQGVSLNQYVLHLLSERHATSKIGQVVEMSELLMRGACQRHLDSKDVWAENIRICRLSISTGSIPRGSTESLLGMIDFLPKLKGFRSIQPAQKELRTLYQGKL
jgi:predicted RNase H-like HicB family nuclease